MDKPPKKKLAQTPRGLAKSDYYLDKTNQSVIFTEAYHRKRGYCCKQKCRHCPWTLPNNP
jgi:Family of unknown function (DUF5522)